MRVLCCVPTYVEAENIAEFLERARAAVPDADLLVIDDNSPDGTAEIAEAAAARRGHVEVLRRPAKAGLGRAYRAGFTVGIERGYDVLVQIDADLSHDPAALPVLLSRIDAGADCPSAPLRTGGSIRTGVVRRGAVRYGNLYAGFVLGTGVHDATSGYGRTAPTPQGRRLRIHRSMGTGSRSSWPTGVTLGRPDRGGPDHLHRPVRGTSKMTWGIFAEELLSSRGGGPRPVPRLAERRSHA